MQFYVDGTTFFFGFVNYEICFDKPSHKGESKMHSFLINNIYITSTTNFFNNFELRHENNQNMTNIQLLSLILSLLLLSGAASNFQTKIIGGTIASIEDYPYQVSLQVFKEHSCGGTILSEDVVITAAHCVLYFKALPIFVSIQAGSTVLYEGGQTIKVHKIHTHKSYDSKTSNNDIAIVTLKQKLVFGPGVQPLNLATERAAPEEIAVATGWGKTERGKLSSKLRVLQLPVLGQQTCIRSYPEELITANMVCAGYLEGGRDTCQGDSGGPLAFNNTLIGIVSWGYACAEEGHPGVFTDVTKYLDDIAHFYTTAIGV